MRGKLIRRTWDYDPVRYAPPRYRKVCHYEAFLPDDLRGFTKPIGSELAGVISEAEAAVHQLNARTSPALTPLARLLLRSEAIASSKVEGIQVDIRDLARAEAKLESGGKTGESLIEVLANIDAMELAIEHATNAQSISVENIVDIHKVLMESARNSHVAGAIRKEQNWIGGNDYNPCGANYVPPPPEEVSRLLIDLCDAINEDHLPPVIQAGLVHAQFAAIHPFLDGNGRTGRALIHVVLRRRGIAPQYVPPISIVLAKKKDRYLQGLSKFIEGEIDEWLTIFAAATAESAKLATIYLGDVDLLQKQWRTALQKSENPRVDAAAWKVIDALPAYPMITGAIATAILGRTKAAVNEAMAQLELAGVLRRASEGRRNRIWEATGLLDLLNDFEFGVRQRG